jgi:hypothetical protein
MDYQVKIKTQRESKSNLLKNKLKKIRELIAS